MLGGLSDHVEQLEQLYQLSPPKQQQLQPAALSAPAEDEIDSQHTDEQRDLWARVGREAAAVAATAAPVHTGIANGTGGDIRHSRVQHDLWAKVGRQAAAAAAAEAADASVSVRRAIQGRSANKSIAAAVAAGGTRAADAGVLPTNGLDTQLQNGDKSRASAAAEGAAAALKRYRNQSAPGASNGQKVVDTDWRAVDDISRQLLELHGLS